MNWVSGVLPAVTGDAILFNASSTLNRSNSNNRCTSILTLTLSGNPGALITVNNNTAALTIANAGGITISAGASQNLTITGSQNLALGIAQSWTANAGRTLTVSTAVANGGFLLTIPGSGNTAVGGIISGTGGLTKSGTGTLTLLTATNTYSGGTTISGGTVQIGNNATPSTENEAALGTGTVTVNTGGVLYYMPGGTANEYHITNAFTLNGGTIKGGDGVQHLGDGGAAFTIGASGGTITSDWFAKEVYIDGQMSGTAALNLSHGTMTGEAAVIRITNSANTYSGTATVTSTGENEFLYLENITAMQYATINLASTGAGTPYLQLGAANANATTTIGGLTGSTGYVQPSATGTFTLNVNNAANNTFSGTLRDNAGTLALTKSGAGTLTFNTAHSYTGVTTVSGGTLQIGDGSVSGDISSSSGITDNAALIFNVIAMQSYVKLIDGSGSFTKSGAAGLTLTRANTYAGGTTVSAGTLFASNSTGSATGSGAVSVSTSATLGGTGTISGTVNINAGGTLAPGDAGVSIGTLTTGPVNFNATSTYSVDLDGTTPTNDRVNSSGAVACAGTLTIASIVNGFNAKVYIIIDAGSVSGNFSGLTEGTSFTQRGHTFHINYTATQVRVTEDAPAASYTWDGGGGDDNWNTGLNWAGNVAPTADKLLAFAGTVRMTPVNNIAAGTSFPLITFNSGANPFTISGNSIALNGDIVNNDNDLQTIGLAMTIASNSVINAASGDITLSGIVSSTGGLTKLGANVLSLTAVNSYTGTTAISAGTLSLGIGGATGEISNSSNVTDNATFRFNRSNAYTYTGAISGTGAVVQAGSGTTTLSSTSNAWTGTTTVSAGTLKLGASGVLPDGSGGGNVILTGTLDLNSYSEDINSLSGAGTVTTAVAGTPTLTVGNDQNATFSGVIQNGSGTVALTKAGSGTQTLSNANTFTGLVTVIGGTLAVTGSYNNNVTSASTTVIGSMANGCLTISGTGAVTTKWIQMGGAANVSGALIQNAGTLTLSGGANVNCFPLGTVTDGYGYYKIAGGTMTSGEMDLGSYLDGDGLFEMAGGTATFNGWFLIGRTDMATSTQLGVINVSGGTLVIPNNFHVGWSATSGAASVLNITGGTVNGATSAVTMNFKTNAAVNLNGGTLQLQQITTTGTPRFNFNGGTLKANTANATFFANGGSAYAWPGGAIIDDNGVAITISQVVATPAGSNGASVSGATLPTIAGLISPPLVRVSGTGTGACAVASIDGSGNLTGVTVTCPGTGYTGSPTFTLSGGGMSATQNFTGTTAANTGGGLTKQGASTLTLSGTNTYDGNTTVSAGTLKLGSGTVIPDGAGKGNVSLTGTLDLNNQSEGINGLSGAGTVTSSVAGSRTLTVGNNDQNSTFAGTIIAGLGTTALTKAGTGTLTLSNTNTYTGATTVSAGTLLVTGSTAAGSAVGVSNTATLGGTGTVNGAITMNNGSTIAPGTGGTTIGTLTTAGVSFSATSTYSVDLNGTTPTYDQINSSGTVALGLGTNAVLTVASIVNSANAKVYIIINATTSVTGTFIGKANASTFVVSGRTLRINYAANQVTLTDVTVGLTPAWMQSSLGTINGGAINESALYLATGSSDYLYSRSLTDGSEKWNYPTGHGACGQPTYFYTGAVYKVLASAVDWVIARQDDGASSSQIFAPLNLAGAGTPYVSYNGASFFVPYTGNLTKRSMADPTSGPVTVAVGSISTSADIVEGSDFVYCATTNGYVNRYDAADLTNLTQSTQISTGPSVNLPLVYSMGTLYVTPNNSTVQAFTTSTMGAAKWSMTYSGAATGATNTGPAYIIQSRDTLYTAAGNYVVKIGCVSGSGTQKWVYDAGGAVNSGPICYSATVYFGRNGGSYYAIDDATGLIRANWPYTSASGNATSGPWIDETNTRVIFGTTGGNLDAFALEP